MDKQVDDRKLTGFDEFDAFMESLHETQSPGIFSNAAEEIGWCERDLPAGFSLKIMTRIRREWEGKTADWRIIGTSLGLFIAMGVLILIAIDHLIGPVEFSRVFSGIFWLMAGLGISMGITALTFFTAGRGEKPDLIGAKGGV